jgi:hypothetical protein
MTVNPSAPPTDCVAVEQMIAQVLRRAHRKAMALNSPDDARGVLYVAHCFADELAAANPQFDRLQFSRAVTDHQS